MEAVASSCSNSWGTRRTSLASPPPITISLLSSFTPNSLSHSTVATSRVRHGLVSSSGGTMRAVNGSEMEYLSPWDDKPYETLPNGKVAYVDEQDLVTFLDPPKELIPLDPSSYNPAAYLWKKIEDIPEERRHRLLHLLNPRLITRAWEIAGTRYEDPKLAKKKASSLLSGEAKGTSLEYYYCRTSGGPPSVAWINFFKKAIFCAKDEKKYGRFIGESLLGQLASSFNPLYFVVTQAKEVMSTEQPCDLAYEFGDGFLDLCDYPESFPKPGKHPYPFDDEVVVYLRHIGPGVLVGQAWQEGKNLQQVPQKVVQRNSDGEGLCSLLRTYRHRISAPALCTALLKPFKTDASSSVRPSDELFSLF